MIAARGQYVKKTMIEEAMTDNSLNGTIVHLESFPSDKENTFIMGSSMGGMISAYAIAECPDVFGGAACLSTHWNRGGDGAVIDWYFC